MTPSPCPEYTSFLQEKVLLRNLIHCKLISLTEIVIVPLTFFTKQLGIESFENCILNCSCMHIDTHLPPAATFAKSKQSRENVSRFTNLKTFAPSSIQNYSIAFFIIMVDEGPKVFELVKINSTLDFLKYNTSSTCTSGYYF